MIRLIASDLDETLLNSEHKISNVNVEAIQKAQAAGIEFMAVTGRDWGSVKPELRRANIICDSILACGGEGRDIEGNILFRNYMSKDDVEQILTEMRSYGGIPLLFTDDDCYIVGTDAELDVFLLNIVRMFFLTATEEEIRASATFERQKNEMKHVTDLKEIYRRGLVVFKVFIFVEDTSAILKLSDKLKENPSLAVASSHPKNLEVTDIRAQKGVVLKHFIESKGYSMDEVMVLGDSLNDLSMIRMNFGATVAVENAVKEVKEAACYLTKSNDENGVAYAIEKLMAGQLEDLKK